MVWPHGGDWILNCPACGLRDYIATNLFGTVIADIQTNGMVCSCSPLK